MPKSRDARKMGDPLSQEFELGNSPFYNMNRAVGVYNAEMDRLLKSVGVDVPRWRILMLAHERGPISISELSDHAVIKLSTTTKAAQRMEKDGLLTLHRRASDARVTEVRLTSDGEAAVQRIRAAASRVYNRATSNFTARDVEILNDLLRRVHKNLSEQL